MSQADQVLEMLLAGEEVTAMSIYAKTGSMAGHSRISELRERGYVIRCTRVQKGKSHWGLYTLLPSFFRPTHEFTSSIACLKECEEAWK